MFLAVFIIALILQSSNGFSINRPIARKWMLMSTVDNTLSVENVKKWYFFTNRIAPEVSLSSSRSKYDLVSDVWKIILASTKVFDADLDLNENLLVYAFPKFHHENGLDSLMPFLEMSTKEVLAAINTTAEIFQPDIRREMEFTIAKDLQPDKEILILTLFSRRTKSKSFDFFMEQDEITSPDDIVTNDIPSFPFQTVYDFISEINRPADPATMASLKYNFKIQDLKYDLEKMAKKKDPKEVVESINCKLTRLEKWQAVLEAPDDNPTNPFIDVSKWSEETRKKYESLKYLAANDPKKALDTQYDKRKVFLKIIEQWIDRLKRNFKYIYSTQSATRGYVDLSKQEDRSVNALRELTSAFDNSVFLEFDGPEFLPGEPRLFYQSDRYDYWSVNYSVEDALLETVTWLEKIDEIQNYAFENLDILGLPINSITQHSYSKGFLSERAMYDFWQSFAAWKKASSIPRLSSSSESDNSKSSNNRLVLRESTEQEVDHQTMFLQSIKDVNTFTRTESLASSRKVREIYSDWSKKSQELVIWWKSLLGELDLDDKLSDGAVITDYGDFIKSMDDIVAGVVEAKNFDEKQMVIAEKLTSSWKDYRPLLEKAVQLQNVLPSSKMSKKSDLKVPKQLKEIIDSVRNDEVVHIPINPPEDTSADVKSAFLLVLPRCYRGVEETTEMVSNSVFILIA